MLLPEALPGIVAGLTISFVSLTGYSAMAGAIGGGGLGDLGIRYGYQRFLPDIMLAVVVVLIDPGKSRISRPFPSGGGSPILASSHAPAHRRARAAVPS